jgi:hypothetical protein
LTDNLLGFDDAGASMGETGRVGARTQPVKVPAPERTARAVIGAAHRSPK